ncbi:MAG TPA: carboxypeptidase regulatory-like domain-containing protein [Planctomycetota bacterium]|nr:carboxypeptidase regulatory-like domain-containing protein [Planctomycetota bacterium]
MRRLLGLWAALSALASCGGGSAEADPPMPPPPNFPAGITGAIRGRVRFEGPVPPPGRVPMATNPECAALHDGPVLDEAIAVRDGRLKNVFVHVKQGLEKYAFPWPTEPVVVSNARCLYVPRVAGAQVHQPVRFVNEDPAAHNIHGFAAQGRFNFTLSMKGLGQTLKFRRPEVMIPLKCDLHPWMIGYLGVVPHPFHRVTGEDGAFELSGLPEGEYAVEAWHEKCGTQTRGVRVTPGATAEVEFVFRAP